MNDRDAFYNSWRKMFERCYNENYHAYSSYGGRRIEVCNRWNKLKHFEEDMLPEWKRGLTLDRIDNDGDYTPENCRWLPKSQNTNKMKSRVDLTELLKAAIPGMPQWALANRFGVSQARISVLLKRARNGPTS